LRGYFQQGGIHAINILYIRSIRSLPLSHQEKLTNMASRLFHTRILFILLAAAMPAQAQLTNIPTANEQAILIHSKALNEDRTLWIHLPDSYTTHNKQSYPVLYLLDGDSHFKYAAEMTSYLAGYDRNRTPEMIVVGIVNVDRGRDFNPTRNGDSAAASRFLQFIASEAVPYVDKNYRTQPYRILAGHSLGGLFALYAWEKAPQLFSSAILISPAIDGANQVFTNRFPASLQHPSHQRGKFFITLGNENPHVVDTLAAMLKKDAPKNLQWQLNKYEAENHFSVTYKSLFDGLKFIYANWFIDFYGSRKMAYKDISTHFDSLSVEFGYKISPTEEFVNNCGYRQLRLGNTSEAIDIFQHNIALFPQSANAYDSMGEAYMVNGDKEKAIANYEKSIRLNPANEDGKAMLQKLKAP